MYRALYEYKASLPDYLSFRAGDQFTITGSANKDWFYAQNGLGQIGLVPGNYIKKVPASAEEILKFVDWSIEAIHLQAASEGGGQYTHEQRATLQKLVTHRSDLAQKLKSEPYLERSRSESTGQPGSGSAEMDEASRRHSERRRAPPPPATVSVEGPKIASSKTAHAPSLPTSKTPNINGMVVDSDNFQTAPNDASPSTEINTAEENQNSVGLISATNVMEQNVAPNTVIVRSPGDGLVTVTEKIHTDGSPTSPPPSLSSSPIKTAAGDLASSLVDVKELLKTVDLPAKIGPELAEEVRKNTGLSFEKSKTAVETVLGYIGFKVPVLEGVADRILSSLHFGRDISDEDVSSHDAKRLDVIFSELTACKDDSQQRSWALHEDEAIIQEYLQELLSILENAKPSICRKVVCRDNYEILHSLVQYYQMETRASICRLLLQVFGALCALERNVVLQLLYSVLPLELAQELKTPTEDVQRVCYVALVMTMLFSTGDSASTAVADQLNQEFFLHILHLIENPLSLEFEDSAVDLLISFILAFNLHLTSTENNVVLKALAMFGTPKVFTERIMVLINRGDDPVKTFDFKPPPPNSVLKLFDDLYSNPATSDLLYTNDAKVLIDVILGRLSNLDTGDQVRSLFLVLCQKVLQNSPYREHCHHVKELHTCLTAIYNEEGGTPEDKRVAQEILSFDFFNQ